MFIIIVFYIVYLDFIIFMQYILNLFLICWLNRGILLSLFVFWSYKQYIIRDKYNLIKINGKMYFDIMNIYVKIMLNFIYNVFFF